MSSHKTLAVIGASDETVAHLRLLMKLGANRLDHQWTWGTEEAADFVAVEVHDLGCQGVIARCQAAGVPVAVMAEPNEVVVHGMVLRRPFKLDQIVAVLNAAGADSATAGPVEAFADDFYTRDLDEIPTGGSDSDDLWTRRERPQASESLHRHAPTQAPAADLDFLIHGDPLVEPEKPKPLITTGTTFDAGDGQQTRRSEGRADQSRHRVMPAGVVGVGPVDVAPIVLPSRNDEGRVVAPPPPGTAGTTNTTLAVGAGGGAQRAAEAEAPGGNRLSDYLEGELLQSPSQMQLPGQPALTLDPKKRAYHAAGDLAGLEPYVTSALPRSLVKGLSTAELTRVREENPARTYDELRWLGALLRSGGRLAGRLDPGGSFQVEAPVQIQPGYHAHGAIAAALATPARLHEITAASGASMEQVFDVVNAYDAIGRLRWTPRQRLAPEPPPEPKGGGLSRFKWPFGKR
jgi:hypothetical protein